MEEVLYIYLSIYLCIYLSIIPGGVDTAADQGEDSIPPVVEEGIAVAVGEGNPKQQRFIPIDHCDFSPQIFWILS